MRGTGEKNQGPCATVNRAALPRATRSARVRLPRFCDGCGPSEQRAADRMDATTTGQMAGEATCLSMDVMVRVRRTFRRRLRRRARGSPGSY